VANNRVARLLKRRASPQPELDAALERLDQLVEASPSLRQAGLLQSMILRTISREPPRLGALELPAGHAAEKLQGGIPLLRDEHVPLDLNAIQELMLQLCQAVREHHGDAGAVDEVAAAIKQRALAIELLVQYVLDGQTAGIRERAMELGVDGEMLCLLLRFSLFPSINRLAAQLAPLRTAATWQQGYCPTCGSWPLLGEYRGLEQTRFLRCGLCATEWAIDRMLCPFCGSRNHEHLSYLHVEGEEQRRAATCEYCRGYVKMLATLAAIPPLELAVYDLATIHLDMIALEHGYAAPL
jgi:FdhE protein